MNKVQIRWRRIKYLWIAVIVLIVLQLLTSCEILKSKSSTQSKLNQSSKQSEEGQTAIQSGNVSKQEVDAKTVWDWWKTTYQFQPTPFANNDTTTIRNYVSTPQPQVIIMEGGKGEQQINATRSDSAFYSQLINWMNTRFDTLSAQQTELSKQKQSETKGVGLLPLILIGVGMVLLNKIIGILRSRYTITKKQQE